MKGAFTWIDDYQEKQNSLSGFSFPLDMKRGIKNLKIRQALLRPFPCSDTLLLMRPVSQPQPG